MRGMTISGVHVDVDGPTDRMGETNTSGQVNFPGLTAGTYRLRFSGEPVTTFEKEVTLRGGQIADLDVALSAAPAKPAPPPAATPEPTPAPAPAVGPAGQPQLTSLYELAEKELSARQQRPQILVACSGNTRSTLVFVTAAEQAQRNYEDAEVAYYVLGGEATFRVDGKDTPLAAGGYVAIPRGTPFAIARRGNRPLSLLSVLSGAPCEEAR
jgi:mannose-6-phosphate isomerase-like protein (cupin superfamily)